MPLPDAVFLGHMLEAIDRIVELTGRTDRATFDRDWVIQDAIIRELEIVGEAAGRLSKTFVSSHPEIPWKEITGIRHRLIHDYFGIDLSIVWETATVNVPEVIPSLKRAATGIEPTDSGPDQAP